MNESGTGGGLVIMDTQSTQVPPRLDVTRTRFSRRAIALVVVALIAAGTIAWLKSQKSPVVPRPVPIAPAVDYTALVRQHIDKAASQDQEALKRFEVSLANVIATYEPRFAVAADAASRKASEYKSIAAIVYYLAWDQDTNQHQVDAYLTQQIGPLIDPVVQLFGRDVGAEMDKLETDLRRISVQLAVDLAEVGPGNPPAPRRIDATTHTKREFDQTLKNLGYSVAGVGVSVGFDAYKIASSQVGADLLRRVTAASSRLFAKQVAKIISSTALSLADGPLPIGDILALAGLVWAAYDTYQMQDDFRNEIRVSAETKFGEIRSAMNTQARVFAGSKVSEFKKLQSTIGSRSADELSSRGTK